MNQMAHITSTIAYHQGGRHLNKHACSHTHVEGKLSEVDDSKIFKNFKGEISH